MIRTMAFMESVTLSARGFVAAADIPCGMLSIFCPADGFIQISFLP
jgi:hypothetical protein